MSQSELVFIIPTYRLRNVCENGRDLRRELLEQRAFAAHHRLRRLERGESREVLLAAREDAHVERRLLRRPEGEGGLQPPAPQAAARPEARGRGAQPLPPELRVADARGDLLLPQAEPRAAPDAGGQPEEEARLPGHHVRGRFSARDPLVANRASCSIPALHRALPARP